MSEITNPSVLDYLARNDRLSDSVLERVLLESQATDNSAVRRETGALLNVLVAAAGAKRVLEVGTGHGYSTIWMARAMPSDGALISIEKDPIRAERARENVRQAGVGDLPGFFGPIATGERR